MCDEHITTVEYSTVRVCTESNAVQYTYLQCCTVLHSGTTEATTAAQLYCMQLKIVMSIAAKWSEVSEVKCCQSFIKERTAAAAPGVTHRWELRAAHRITNERRDKHTLLLSFTWRSDSQVIINPSAPLRLALHFIYCTMYSTLYTVLDIRWSKWTNSSTRVLCCSQKC